MSQTAGGAGAAGSGTVETTIDGHVALVTMRRPPHNLLTVPMLAELADQFEGLDGRARVAVLAAEGKSFCAGADFKSEVAPDPTAGASFEQTTAAFYAQALRVFETPVPVVAAIGGGAIGAGFGLALACDMRVVSEATGGSRSTSSVSESTRGSRSRRHSPVWSVRALRLTSCTPHDASTRPRRYGSVSANGSSRRAPRSESAMAIATEIATGAPGAVAATRATLRDGLSAMARDAMEHELDEQVGTRRYSGRPRGRPAMLERRPPRFGGDDRER